MKYAKAAAAVAVAFVMLAVPFIAVADASDATAYKDEEKGVMYESKTLTQADLDKVAPDVKNNVCKSILDTMNFKGYCFNYSDITLSDVKLTVGYAYKVSDGKTVSTTVSEISGKAKFTATAKSSSIGSGVMNWTDFSDGVNTSDLEAFFGYSTTDGYTITFDGKFNIKEGTQEENDYVAVSGDTATEKEWTETDHREVSIDTTSCTVKTGASETAKKFSASPSYKVDHSRTYSLDYGTTDYTSITLYTQVKVSAKDTFANCDDKRSIDYDLNGKSVSADVDIAKYVVPYTDYAYKFMDTVDEINMPLQQITTDLLTSILGSTVQLSDYGSVSTSYGDVTSEFSSIGPSASIPGWVIAIVAVVAVAFIAAIVVVVVILVRKSKNKSA